MEADHLGQNSPPIPQMNAAQLAQAYSGPVRFHTKTRHPNYGPATAQQVYRAQRRMKLLKINRVVCRAHNSLFLGLGPANLSVWHNLFYLHKGIADLFKMLINQRFDNSSWRFKQTLGPSDIGVCDKLNAGQVRTRLSFL